MNDMRYNKGVQGGFIEPETIVHKTPNFFSWWLVDMPIYYWNLTVKITRRVLIFFSIPVLIRTLFAPWKRDIHMPVNASLDLVFKAIMDNFISRIIGFIVRFFTIIVGLLASVVCFLTMIVILVFWLCLPVLVCLIIFAGFV